MRIVMIHALAESIPPVRLAFGDVFPEAQVINLLDEGLFLDFGDHLTPKLRRRMNTLIAYAAEHGADAIGLACSVYAPVVDTVGEMVDIPLVSSYGPVMADAVELGPRVGIIASVPATLKDAQYYLEKAAKEANLEIEPVPCLAPDLINVLRSEGEAEFKRRLAEEVEQLTPNVNAVVLSQFSMATALSHLETVSSVPVLSAPHSSARRLKEMLIPA